MFTSSSKWGWDQRILFVGAILLGVVLAVAGAYDRADAPLPYEATNVENLGNGWQAFYLRGVRFIAHPEGGVAIWPGPPEIY